MTDFVSFVGGSLARIRGATITYTYLDHLGTPVRTSHTLSGLSTFERYSPDNSALGSLSRMLERAGVRALKFVFGANPDFANDIVARRRPGTP